MKQFVWSLLLISASLTAFASEQQVPKRRTNGAVTFKQNFCACNDQQSILVSRRDCDVFCLERETLGVDTLYFDFKLGRKAIAQGFRNVTDWCTMVLNDSNNPQCVLEVRSISGREPAISFSIIPQGNFFEANISTLATNKTYVLNLKELTSGAKSNSVIIQKRR